MVLRLQQETENSYSRALTKEEFSDNVRKDPNGVNRGCYFGDLGVLSDFASCTNNSGARMTSEN